jgi:hypothetical protein
MTLLLLFNQPPLHEDLLNSAHQFIEQSHYGVAVVLAQTAFEVFTAQVRSQLIQRRQLTAMGDWIAKGTRRVDARIDFYVAVTRDQIQQDGALWPQYRAHAERRHGVVHQGRQVSKDEAEGSCRAVENMISRMKQVVEQQA